MSTYEQQKQAYERWCKEKGLVYAFPGISVHREPQAAIEIPPRHKLLEDWHHDFH